MNRRVIAALLVLVLVCSVCATPTLASDDRSSAYIDSASASIKTGTYSGQIKLSYAVYSAIGSADRIGVSKIQVYNSSGSLYNTILGTVTNGLVATHTISHSGNYTLNCVAGNSYYCVVTFFVSDSTGGDTCTITTNTATAHS